jgi:hypothetical protein
LKQQQHRPCGETTTVIERKELIKELAFTDFAKQLTSLMTTAAAGSFPMVLITLRRPEAIEVAATTTANSSSRLVLIFEGLNLKGKMWEAD